MPATIDAVRNVINFPLKCFEAISPMYIDITRCAIPWPNPERMFRIS